MNLKYNDQFGSFSPVPVIFGSLLKSIKISTFHSDQIVRFNFDFYNFVSTIFMVRAKMQTTYSFHWMMNVSKAGFSDKNLESDKQKNIS